MNDIILDVLIHLYGRADDYKGGPRFQLVDQEGTPTSPRIEEGREEHFLARFNMEDQTLSVLLLHPGGLKFPRRVLPAQTLLELNKELIVELRKNKLLEEDLVDAGFSLDVAQRAFEGKLTLNEIAEFRFE